jgi:glycopeptide antibiotics resistance protein
VKDGSPVDWGVNALLFIPTAFCILGATHSNTFGWVYLVRLFAVAAFCLSMSLAIEYAQNWFPPRVPSLGDVVAQFWGATAGLVGWCIFGNASNRFIVELSSASHRQGRLKVVLLGYLVGLLCFSLIPLDLSLHPSDILQKFRDGRILLIPFSHVHVSGWNFAYHLVSDISLFVPVGVLAALVMAQSHKAYSWIMSLLLGCGIVAGLEFLQLFVMSRHSDSTDILVGGIGVAMGIAGFRLVDRRPQVGTANSMLFQTAIMCTAAAYAVVVLATFWAPFDFNTANTELIRERMSRFFSLPLSQELQGSYVAALYGFLQKFTLFIPFGCLVELFAGTLRPGLRGVTTVVLLCITAGFAIVIELGKILLPSRFASFDDILICVAGSIVGLFCAKFVGTARSAGDPQNTRRPGTANR